MPTWPTSGGFPQAPRQGSWQIQPEDIVSEFETAMGPARRRRRVTAASYRCSGTFRLTAAQWATLETFWRTDCAAGSIAFTMRDPDNLVASRTFEWAEAPRLQQITADRYLVSVSLIRD